MLTTGRRVPARPGRTGARTTAAVVGASLALVTADGALAREAGRPAAAPAVAVATVAGAPISFEALEARTQVELIRVRAEEYGIRRKVLEEMVADALLDQEAAARKITREELVRSQIEAAAPPVPDEEVQASWELARPRLPAIPDAQGLARTRTLLTQRAVTLRKGEYLRELAARWGAKLLLDPVRIALPPIEGLSFGPAEAPVTVAEFTDFTCPHCARGHLGIKKLLEAYPGQVRVVVYDLPRPAHTEAPKAAEAVQCAHEQGHYWGMRDKLFANQETLGIESLKRYARELGLNGGEFDSCLDTSRHTRNWDDVRAAAAAHGIAGTPTYLVNGRPAFGAVPFEYMSVVVDEELGRFVLSSYVPMQGTPARAGTGR